MSPKKKKSQKAQKMKKSGKMRDSKTKQSKGKTTRPSSASRTKKIKKTPGKVPAPVRTQASDTSHWTNKTGKTGKQCKTVPAVGSASKTRRTPSPDSLSKTNSSTTKCKTAPWRPVSCSKTKRNPIEVHKKSSTTFKPKTRPKSPRTMLQNAAKDSSKQHILSAELKTKVPKGKEATNENLFDDENQPTMLIAPKDYEHMYTAKKSKQPASLPYAPKTKVGGGGGGSPVPSKAATSPDEPSIPEDAPTALIAPADYEHIFTAKPKTPLPPQAVFLKSKPKGKESSASDEPSIPEDAPTLLIAPDDYQHIYSGKRGEELTGEQASPVEHKVKPKVEEGEEDLEIDDDEESSEAD